MGLFGGNWSKAGPGVDKDAPQKKGIFLYFEIFIRKFWNLIHANVLYFTASILFLVMLYVVAPIPTTVVNSMTQTMMESINPEELVTSSNNAEGEQFTAEQLMEQKRVEVEANLQVTLRSMFALMIFGLWGCAPMAAGYAYITRCYAREQHAWVWSDFKDKVKENFRQSVVALVIDIVVLLLSVNAAFFYYMSYLSTSQTMWLVACSAICIIFLIYTMMHFYLYQLMVTFRCTLKQLYRNALLLAVAKLPVNIVFIVLILVLNYVLFMFLSPAVAVGASFFIWVSIQRFPVEFYTARMLEKNFINGVASKPDPREAER